MLIFLLTILVLAAAVYGGYYFWKQRIDADLAEGAGAEYERLQRADPTLVEGLSEARFREIYTSVEMPRFPGYMVAIIIAFLIGTPVFLALLAGGDVLMQEMGVIPPSNDIVTTLAVDSNGQTRVMSDVSPEALQYYVEDLGGFYYFFGLLAFWVVVVFYFMHRYHSRTPGSVRDEIIRLR